MINDREIAKKVVKNDKKCILNRDKRGECHKNLLTLQSLER